MLKSSIKDRIIFPSVRSQIKFLAEIKSRKRLTLNNLAAEWNINVRTLTDWMNGSHKLPFDLAILAAKEFSVILPTGVRRMSWREHAKAAGQKGARANLLKNGQIGGSPKKRLEKWRQWWETKGRFNSSPILKAREIDRPLYSADFAEFIGIMLGDGTMAVYYASISLNKDELPYAEFISGLIKKLFGIDPKIYFKKSCHSLDIVIPRKKLVDFLQVQGLPKGDKVRQGATIPDWIMENIKFQKACIRGLIDTDGCFFVHTYQSNGKKYQYLKIDFTSRSMPLLLRAQQILINLQFNVRIGKSGNNLRIEDKKEVARYLREIGTNNSRYEKKLKDWRVALNGKAAVC